jgi:hypothetical protein
MSSYYPDVRYEQLGPTKPSPYRGLVICCIIMIPTVIIFNLILAMGMEHLLSS